MRPRDYALLGLLALGLRALAAAWLGPGPFGPDGPGAAAAAQLGGHPYPLHPLLIGIFGARPLSVLAGAVTALASARLGVALGGSGWGAGLLAACAPLLLHASALAGGDAAATAFAAGGLAAAWSGWPLLGGALAGLSLGVKPIAAPLLPLLLLASLAPQAPRFASLKGAAGALAAAAPFWASVAPLLRPRPRSGILGSWWLSSEGAPPPLGRWPELALAGAERIAEMPSWTTLQLIILLSLIGAWRAKGRLGWAGWALALVALWAPATLIGEQLRPRYLGPASVMLVALAGRALSGRLAGLALGAAWPAMAFMSQLAALRAQEEALPERPTLPWAQPIDVRGAYMDSGICGAGELRAMAAELARSSPQGATVRALRLRDGREGELTWPLLAARPDLRVEVIDGGRCPDGACLGEPLALPGDTSRCQTPVVDPGERPVVEAAEARFGRAVTTYRLLP